MEKVIFLWYVTFPNYESEQQDRMFAIRWPTICVCVCVEYSMFLASDCVFEAETWSHACLSLKSHWPLTSLACSLQRAGVVCVSVVSDRCVCFFSVLAEVEKIWRRTGTTSRLQGRISRPGHSCVCRPSRCGPAAHENCCCFPSGLDFYHISVLNGLHELKL